MPSPEQESTTKRIVETAFVMGVLTGSGLSIFFWSYSDSGGVAEILVGLMSIWLLFVLFPLFWMYYGGAIRHQLGIGTVEPFYWVDSKELEEDS